MAKWQNLGGGRLKQRCATDSGVKQNSGGSRLKQRAQEREVRKAAEAELRREKKEQKRREKEAQRRKEAEEKAPPNPAAHSGNWWRKNI